MPQRRGGTPRRQFNDMLVAFVVRIEFARTAPFDGRASFGNTGPYARPFGPASVAIDPNDKELPFTCDLEFPPRKPEGVLEFKTILEIVKPVALSMGNRKLIFDLS